MEFLGKIGRRLARLGAVVAAPARHRRTGAPNVLLVVLDDVGFAQLGCYGSDIETPCIDGSPPKGCG